MIDESKLIWPDDSVSCHTCKFIGLDETASSEEGKFRWARCKKSREGGFASTEYKFTCKGKHYEADYEQFPTIPRNVVVIDNTRIAKYVLKDVNAAQRLVAAIVILTSFFIFTYNLF